VIRTRGLVYRYPAASGKAAAGQRLVLKCDPPRHCCHTLLRQQGHGTFLRQQDSNRFMHQLFKIEGRDGKREFPQIRLLASDTGRAGADEIHALGLRVSTIDTCSHEFVSSASAPP
jgi:hypothetical protein